MEKTSEKIIQAMILDKDITISDIANEFSISTLAVELAIAKLKKEKTIQRVGGAKGGYWKVSMDKTGEQNEI